MFAPQTIETMLHARVIDAEPPVLLSPVPARRALREAIALSVFEDLSLVEADWRAFETVADATAFQSFAWHSAWLRHIAPHEPVTPAVVVGRDASGAMLFLLPLAVERGRALRRLIWLGSDLCDYNGPLLARDFAQRVTPERFIGLWQEIGRLLQSRPRLRHDAVVLEKMPATVGGQANPFLALSVALNPSGAYLTALGKDWESFYTAKRSSATRRRDRTKRKRLGYLGEVRFVTPEAKDEIEANLLRLFGQKAKSFAKMGVANMFVRPGYADFFRDLATNPASRNFVHVSRLDVGATLAAANFGLVFRGRYYHILASYDDGDVAKFGPGAAHLHELMRYAIEHGCREFDFTIGDEGYKRDWWDTETTLYDYRSAANWRGFVVALPSAAMSRVKRTIKQTPFLWRNFIRLRALAGALFRRAATTPAPVEPVSVEDDAAS
jgi:CelD/BcsL family acetyltransferase involved in cellulose biosynthesis